jgi:hypothetical protein
MLFQCEFHLWILNHLGTMPVATTLSVWQGTELTPGSSHTWTVSPTVQEEVQAAFKAGLADGTLADATSWSFELASGIAFRVKMFVKFSLYIILVYPPFNRGHTTDCNWPYP